MKQESNEKTQPDVFYGIGVSPGIAIGRVFVVDRHDLRIQRRKIAARRIAGEKKRFLQAVERSKRQIAEIQNQIESRQLSDNLHFLDILHAHLLILEDRKLLDETCNLIAEKQVNAEWALKEVLDRYKEMFDAIEDEYLRERRSDIDSVESRIQRNLLGLETESVATIAEKVIVVAHDLSPADTAQMDRGKIMGFATNVGGKTSHTAIMARSLEIPAVVGLENITSHVSNGDILILDGSTGTVILNPDQRYFNIYLDRQQKFKYREKSLLEQNKDLPAETKDGHRVFLLGNIELPSEVGSVLDHGGLGIGLYRTEFLFLNRRHLPTEEEHFEVYKSVLEGIAPHPATIRTFDLGGDKFVSSMRLPEEVNPALGLRAIRLCLEHDEIFRVQLRALLRASVHGKLRIMFPLISGIEELKRTKEIIEEIQAELTHAGIPFDPDVEIGTMIEVPSAAVIADLLAEEVDFFSIGTNDLIQYALAIDRINEHVSYLYEPLHPAILRMLRMIVEAAHSHGIPVSVCGEMAGEELYTLVLLGLGVDQLSMTPLSIPRVKQIIRESTIEAARGVAEACMTLSTAAEIERFVADEMATLFPEHFMRPPERPLPTRSSTSENLVVENP